MSVSLTLYRTIESDMKNFTQDPERERELRESLSRLGEKYFKAESTPVVSRFQNKGRIWLFAGAFLLVLTFFVYHFFSIQNKRTSVLYSQYMEVPFLSPGIKEGGNDLLTNAISAYNNKDYKKALENFNRYLAIDSSGGNLVLARNICLMKTGQIDKSITALQKLAEEKTEFKYEANWYIALDFLMKNHKDSCKKVLEEIPSTSGFYLKATSLLKNL